MSIDRASWQVKDTAILSELLGMLEISAEEAALLAALEPHARACASELTEAFYARLFKHANTAEYLKGISRERLNSMASTWFIELFGGTYDESYARRRMHIGEVHVRIGLPVRYPLMMLDMLIPFGERVASHSTRPEQAAQAFRKLLALDIAIFNQAFEDNQLHHLAELVGGERLARRLLTGEV